MMPENTPSTTSRFTVADVRRLTDARNLLQKAIDNINRTVDDANDGTAAACINFAQGKVTDTIQMAFFRTF